MNAFEPTIVAFFCNWCTYTAADLAGTSRLSYPPNIKIIRMMCSGMVDPKYVIKAFLGGADGVLVSGRTLIPGADRFIKRLQGSDAEYLVLTNNPLYTPGDLAHRLKNTGLDIPAERIFTSAMATMGKNRTKSKNIVRNNPKLPAKVRMSTQVGVK